VFNISVIPGLSYVSGGGCPSFLMLPLMWKCSAKGVIRGWRWRVRWELVKENAMSRETKTGHLLA